MRNIISNREQPLFKIPILIILLSIINYLFFIFIGNLAVAFITYVIIFSFIINVDSVKYGYSLGRIEGLIIIFLLLITAYFLVVNAKYLDNEILSSFAKDKEASNIVMTSFWIIILLDTIINLVIKYKVNSKSSNLNNKNRLCKKMSRKRRVKVNIYR